MNHLVGKFFILILISFGIKLLLIPAYYSTDFAVHQNWLRITSQLPMSDWYYDAESKWTLDYPPFFAYFEWVLSKVAEFFDSSITKDINEHVNTIYFQRISVIVTDVIYLLMLLKVYKSVDVELVVSFFSLNFLILDNIHFQYNILLQSLFILAIYLMKRGQYLLSAFAYSSLLNFKHLYLYSSPAFFIYLLKNYIYNSKTPIKNLLQLAITTLCPFILSLGPFYFVTGIEGISQIFSRLFPFQRGLVHQYWAPNFWAIYFFADKILNVLLVKLNMVLPTQTSTSGLKILADVSPFMTIIIILVFLVPIMVKAWKKEKTEFAELACVCGLIFFTFGFHVHEKAITPYINILFIFIKPKLIYLATFVNIVNLLPLLIQPPEKILCIIFPIIWILIWYKTLQKNSFFSKIELLFIISGLLIVFYHHIVHPFIQKPQIEFLPLMMNSVWAAVFNLCWTSYLYLQYIVSQ